MLNSWPVCYPQKQCKSGSISCVKIALCASKSAALRLLVDLFVAAKKMPLLKAQPLRSDVSR